MEFMVETAVVSPLMVELLNNADAEKIRRRLCHDVSRPGIAAGEFKYSNVVGGLRQWIGDRAVHGLQAAAIPWRSRPYEYTVGYNKNNADDMAKAQQPAKIAEEVAAGAAPGKLFHALQACRDSGLAIDNQAFFSAGHSQLVSGATTSNLFNRGVGSLPATGGDGYTQAQADFELNFAMSTLSQNRVSGGDIVISSPTRAADLLVVCYHTDQFHAMSRLRDAQRYVQDGVAIPNPFAGLTVLMDLSTSAAAYKGAHAIDFYYCPENGAFRPIVWVIEREIDEVKVDVTREFASGDILVGIDGKFSPNPAFWQVALRIDDGLGG